MSLKFMPALAAMLRNVRSKQLNRNMIGYRIEKTTEPMKEADFTAFAEATRDPVGKDRAEITHAPPLYLAKLIIPMLRSICFHKDLHMNLLRMVHAGQQVRWHEGIKVGDSLTLSLRIDDISDTPAGEKIRLMGQAHKGSILALEGVTELIVRGRQIKRPQRSEREKEPLKESYRATIHTVEGQQLKYAAVSGDNNFIHTNKFLARMAGLPRTIMHGACLLAMYCTALTRKVANKDNRRLKSIGGRFTRPVLPGQSLTLTGYETTDPGALAFDVSNSEGKTVFADGMFVFSALGRK